MKRQSTKNKIFIFTVGSILNLMFFCLTKYTSFPFWLDYSGTIYIAALGCPGLAIASLLIHTLLLLILIDGACALLPMITILFVGAIVYHFNTNFERSVPNSLAMTFCSITVGFIVNTLIILISQLPLGRYNFYSDIFTVAKNTGGLFFASVTVSAVITFIELLLSFIIVAISGLLTPRKDESLIFKK